MKNIPYSKEQLMRANVKLMEQNKRYRKALEFYADEENYMPNVFNQWEPVIKIWKDSGEKACKALEGESDE